MMKFRDWASIPSKAASHLCHSGAQTSDGKPLLRQIGIYASRCVLLAASLTCIAFPSHATNPELIPVANHTNFSDEVLGKYLAENLNQNLKDEIAKRNLAVFAHSATFPGQRACFATVGLTEAAPANRNARFPIFKFRSYERVAGENWNPKTECGSERLVSAIKNMNSAPLEEVLTGIESTASAGGNRPKMPLKTDWLNLFNDGIEDPNSLLGTIREHQLSAAFDYRYVQTSVFAAGAKLDSGEYMCVSFAGLAANSPDGRQSRWPSVTTGYVRFQTGGTVEGCKGFVAKQAIHGLLEKPWTADGLLKSFELTREDGIPLPDAAKVAKARAKIDRAARVLAENEARRAKQPKNVKVVSTTRTSNRLSCKNSCVNGSCVRTLPDGSREQWQAPRKFDPFNNNWGWDTTTNACGT